MGVSPAKFTSAGQTSQHYIPGVYSRRRTLAGGTGVSSGNLVIIGTASGGEPGKLLAFGDKAEAKEELVSGDLLDGVAQAFNGSNDFVPQTVFALKVNKSTRGSLTLESGGYPALTLKSAMFGPQANQLKLRLTDGTTGRKLTCIFKGSEIAVDDIGRDSFTLQYTGSGTSPVCTVGHDGMSLSASRTPTVDDDSTVTDALTIKWDECGTLEELAAKISDTDAWRAVLLDTTANVPCEQLDHVSGVEVGTDSPTVIKSDFQALLDAIAKIPFIGETRLEGTRRVMPDNLDGYAYFTGAENGTSRIADWLDALDVLKSEDIQIIATPSTDPDVHSIISDHCTEMSTVTKKRERTFWAGMPEGTSIEAGIAEAKSLNTDLGSVVITGANANSPFTGAAEDISPALLSCKCAGMEAALGVSNPLTNKVIKVNAFSKKYTDSELDKMIAGGVVPFGVSEDGQLVCIRAITCYQGDSLIRNERSMTRAVLYMDRDLRKAYARRTGSNSAPSESEIIQILLNKGKEWYRDDLVTIGDEGKPVFDEKVRFDGDKTYLTFTRYIRAPNNFTFITGTNMVYSSTVEL